MKILSKKLWSVTAVLVMLFQSFAFTAEEPVMIRGVRPLGMGSTFVAISDDQNAMFYNPAGLTQRTGSQLTIFDLPINIAEDIFSFSSFYSDNHDKLQNFDTLSTDDKSKIITDINNKITTYKPRIRLGFPNTSYVSGPGFLSWGLGFFDQADLGFQLKSGILIPNISFWGNVDAIAAVPLAHCFQSLPFSIPGKLSVGTTLKFISRTKIAEFNKSILEFEDFDPLLQNGSGFGMDIGTMYMPNSQWNLGLQVSDFGGTTINYAKAEKTKTGEIRPSTSGVIYPQWNVGAAYIPSKIYYWPGKSVSTKDRLILSADIRDIFNSDEALLDSTFFKKLHLGAELKWAIFAVRGGFNSGYPSVGFGVNLFVLQVEYAYWGDELGKFAGQIPEWNHQLNLTMRFGQNKGRDWGNKTVKTAPPAVQPAVEIKTEPLISGSTAPALITSPAEIKTDPVKTETAKPDVKAEDKEAETIKPAPIVEKQN